MHAFRIIGAQLVDEFFFSHHMKYVPCTVHCVQATADQQRALISVFAYTLCALSSHLSDRFMLLINYSKHSKHITIVIDVNLNTQQ